ncbi:MAG: hypothetical protein GXY24_01540 [Bacteroidales bacterium]|mgnify:CR=1 FL=1|jgi:hypothetical protein|nr:hypothetical protein [Bacteroidales bacterium]
MNNVFDFKRFGNYFLYDLRRAKNNYWISLLLMGLMPVALYIICQFFSLITGNGVTDLSDVLKFDAVFVSIVAVMLGAGTKIYGKITEKQSGSDYLMLPASTFEKWLSMVLVVCIVLPLVLFALMFVSDGFMSLVFPNSYGDRILSFDFARGLIEEMMNEEGFYFNMPAVLFLDWCETLLIFTLGAVCFKKSKVAKTLLCLFAFGMVITPLMFLFLGTTSIDNDWIIEHFTDPDKALAMVNWTLSIVYTVMIGGLLAGLYFRLRTLKH